MHGFFHIVEGINEFRVVRLILAISLLADRKRAFAICAALLVFACLAVLLQVLRADTLRKALRLDGLLKEGHRSFFEAEALKPSSS